MKRILWFRRDLRCEDNPLLSQEGEVLPIFIFDPAILAPLKRNDRRLTFIFRALRDLKLALRKRGLDLAVFYGKPSDVFEYLLQIAPFDEVCASGDYDAYARERDRAVSMLLPFRYLRDTYVFSPEEVLKNDGTPYLVFTPFYKRTKEIFTPEHLQEYFPLSQHTMEFDYEGILVIGENGTGKTDLALESIGFVPAELLPLQQIKPDEKLERFSTRLAHYSVNRDRLDIEGTSMLSTDLRFGTLSIRSLLRWLARRKKEGIDTEPFFRQLMFREFYASMLYHFPHLARRNFRYSFYGIEDHAKFDSFTSAKTGVPVIDAAITQLIETGEMHNRARMICASFFTKNLFLPWQWGEAFFAEHLMDYDAASNILSWQWSAGTGVDPQPYFRIFNPYAQMEKFDPEGGYVTKHLPALREVPAKFLRDENKLFSGIADGYPRPVVEQKKSAAEALAHFRESLNVSS